VTTGFLFEIFNEQRASAVIDRVKSQSIKLRPYQAAAVDSAYAQWNDVRSTLINLATRFGKFIVFPPQPDYPKRSHDLTHNFSTLVDPQNQLRVSDALYGRIDSCETINDS